MPKNRDDEFTEFAAASLGSLRATAYLMCGDWQRAEDVTQEALIRVYRNWRRIERKESVAAHARTTVVWLVVDESRRPWRRERPGLSTHADDRRAGAVVVLRHHADLSVAETARVLGCSEGTVKSQTVHALAQLRELLGDNEITESAGASS